MKYFKNFDVVLFGTSSGTFGDKMRSVAQSVFHLKITLFFGRKRHKKYRFWKLYFENHVKNSKSSPIAKIFSHLEDIMPNKHLYC